MNVPSNPNPLQVASFTERLARERQGTKLGMVFSAITAIGVGATMAQAILELMEDSRQRNRSRGWER
ncbi:MAG TPA: hypothetical protein VN688_34415 [Gemmataceae bacterium]|nr:hypothetical protein [Gemmataceae bacterium]